MKRIIPFLFLLASVCFKLNAETYLDGNIFGQRLLSMFKCYCHNYSNDVFVDSLISANFTEELKTVLFEDLHGGHGYDFITMGFYDYENIESSATVMVRDHYLTIKYNYLGWPSNQLDTDSVYYFFNSEGKISHIMRPEDQHVIPNDVPIESITFRYTVDPTLYSFGQDMYTNKIKWEEHVETITCSDTIDIVSKIQQGCKIDSDFYNKKLLTVGDETFYCVFVPIGSGIPLWLISVYKKTDNNWYLVERGTVVRKVLVLTARINSNNDKILFFTANATVSKTAIEVKEEVEEIGELSLSDLLK